MHPARASILVVEDDPAVARALVDALEMTDYRVWHAVVRAVGVKSSLTPLQSSSKPLQRSSPVGVQLLAPALAEPLLFRAAAVLERSLA